VHPWQSLREELGQYLNQGKSRESFNNVLAAHESLSRFPSTEDLIRFLHDRSAGCAEEKNRILGTLIRCAHDDHDLFPVVRALIFLALFPALDRVFHSLLPHVHNTREPEAKLTNDIFWAFHLEIEGWDFEVRSRVAATLQLNVRRKVKKKYVKTTSPFVTPATHTDVSAAAGMSSIWEQITSGEQDSTTPDMQKLKEVLRSTFRIKDIDAELILGRLVQKRSFADLAQQLGIKEENARQRFRRAKKLIRSRKKSGF